MPNQELEIAAKHDLQRRILEVKAQVARLNSDCLNQAAAAPSDADTANAYIRFVVGRFQLITDLVLHLGTTQPYFQTTEITEALHGLLGDIGRDFLAQVSQQIENVERELRHRVFSEIRLKISAVREDWRARILDAELARLRPIARAPSLPLEPKNIGADAESVDMCPSVQSSTRHCNAEYFNKPATKVSLTPTGSGWKMVYDGREAFVRATGFNYIHQLMCRGREIAAVELQESITSPDHSSISIGEGIDSSLRSGHSNGDAAIDDRTIRETEAKIDRLRDDRLLAEDTCDQVRLTEIDEEIHDLTEYLHNNRNKNGRPRRLGSRQEQARTAVTRAIGRAIEEAGRKLPGSKEWLKAHIKTGATCEFIP